MTAQQTIDPQPGDLRVWHIPQIPGEPFTWRVASVAEGKTLLEVLAAYDEFQLEHGVRGDFASAQGLERYEESGGNPGDLPYDWFEVDLEFEFFEVAS